MKTVLFATRVIPELAPLVDSSCVALVSVACKPLIVHTVESLAMAGLTDVIVVVSPDADAVEAALGDGTRWGMRFEYVLATSRRSDEQTVECIRHRLGEEYLLVRGEMLRTPIIAEFVERARTIEARLVIATIRGDQAGVRLVRDETHVPRTASDSTANSSLSSESESRVDFSEGRLSLLESLAAFHRSNLDVLAGHFTGLLIPGREVAPRARVGRHTSLPLKAIRATPLLIGSRCSVADNAELWGDVVVSNDVVIDGRAVIRSSIIMPHTYVGKLVEVSNAIVVGNRLIHVDTGAIATVVDSFLLASIHHGEVGARVRDLVDRAIGALLLAASFWLWPIALIASVAINPGVPIRTRILIGNRKRGSQNLEFRAFEFAISVPVLRYIPYLLAVVSGRLRLVGVEPLEPSKAAARTEEWQLARDEGKVGLFGPAQLMASNDTPDEQLRIVEAFYVGTQSIAEDLKWLIRAAATFVSRRAWRSTKSSQMSDFRASLGPTPATFAGDRQGTVEFESFELEPFETIPLAAREAQLKADSPQA